MGYKPVDTAITVIVGPLIDDSDFKTLEEAIAYNAAGMDVSLIVEKTDGTTGITAITLTTGGTSDWTHKDGGYYEIEITAAQNIEEGIGFVRGICTGVLPFESAHYNIVVANIYDSLIKGTDKLQVDTAEISGDSTAADNLEIDYDGTGYAKTNSTIGTCTTNTDMRGTDSANTTVPDAAGVAPTAAEIRTEMDNNSTKMAPSQVLNDYKATGFNTVVPDVAGTAPTAAEIKTEVEQAGSSLAQILTDTGTTLPDRFTGIEGAGFLTATDSNEAIRNRGDAEWATATGFNTVVPDVAGTAPTAVEIRTEMEGAGSKILAIEGDTNELQTNQGNWLTATSVTVSDKTGFSLSAVGVDAILDAVIEGTHTFRQYMRTFASMLISKVTGGGTDTITFRDVDDSKDRIVTTVTADGDRTAVVLNES